RIFASAKPNHFEGGQRGFFAFVAMRASQSFPGLLFIIQCKHTKYYRNRQRYIELCNAFSNCFANVFEMRCSSPNDGAKSYDGFGQQAGGSTVGVIPKTLAGE